MPTEQEKPPDHEEAARGFWNEQSGDWAAKCQSEQKQTRLRNIVELIARHAPGGRALDVGCGEGSLCLELARRGFDVYGCDLSEKMVEESVRRLEPVVPDATERVRTSREGRFPFEGPFDLVAVLGVIVYVPKHAEYFKRLAGLLKPGGVLVVSGTQRRSLRAGYDICRHLRRPSRSPEWRRGLVNLVCTGVWSGGLMAYRGAERTYSAGALERLLARTGFEVLDRMYLFDFEPLDRRPLERSILGRAMGRCFGWRPTLVARLRQPLDRKAVDGA